MKMYTSALFVICTLTIVAQVKSQECLAETREKCEGRYRKNTRDSEDCHARYGAIEHLRGDLAQFASTHIKKSFEYLLMSTHFGNYDMNRQGFEKLFRAYSDSKWENGIELIKHINKRGGKMDFGKLAEQSDSRDKNYELYEIQSLAKALDMEKSIMQEAYDIHEKAIRKLPGSHDPEISHYIEEEFVEKEADKIRELTGHITELSQMLANGEDSALSLYLFDDYLKGL